MLRVDKKNGGLDSTLICSLTVLDKDQQQTEETNNGTGTGKICCAAFVEANGTIRSSIDVVGTLTYTCSMDGGTNESG